MAEIAELRRLNMVRFECLPPQPPLRKAHKLNLFCVRLFHGIDWFGVFARDLHTRAVQLVARSQLEPVAASEGEQLRALEETLRALPSEGWQAQAERVQTLGLGYAAYDQESLQSWLGRDRLAPDGWPNLTVLGRIPCRSTRVEYLYLAVWLFDAHEIMMPKTASAQAVEDRIRGVELDPEQTGEPFETSPPDRLSQLSLSQLEADSACLPLRRPLTAYWSEDDALVWVEGFSPALTGDGHSSQEAIGDFSAVVHGWFQALYRTRPFNRDEQQERLWRLLCRFIDVQAYRDHQPLVLFRLGRIVAVPSESTREVEWEEDARRETVHLEAGQAPDDFGKILLDSWFEAEVAYDRRTQVIQKIVAARPVSKPPEVREEDLDEFLRNLKTVPPA
jgi:hypothetical protein